MSRPRYQRILEVLARRQPDLTIMAEAVYKPHNLSAMLRSCDAVGVGAIHAVQQTGGIPTFRAASASAEKWVEIMVHPDVETAIGAVRNQGMQVLAAHLSAEAIDFRQVDYSGPTCIMFGNERDGISPRAEALADQHIMIPMLGMVRSLNVSVAAAVILFEAQRQRLQGGLYTRPRLSSRVIHDTAFHWLYPREAALFRARGVTLPPLDDDGCILPPAATDPDTTDS